jgi:hypothetical protein
VSHPSLEPEQKNDTMMPSFPRRFHFCNNYIVKTAALSSHSQQGDPAAAFDGSYCPWATQGKRISAAPATHAHG